ncbi:ankyrin repeat-containing domain protein [Mycena epipterygia]|nr:ankyrin repeat-containing domain protein [Mycena epipterygia]
MGENRNILDTRIGKITKDLNETKAGLEDIQIPGSLKKDVEEYAGLLAKASALISAFDGQNKAFRAINQKEWASGLTALECELDSFASRFIIKRGIETQIGLNDVQISVLAKKLQEWLKFPSDMAEKQHAMQKLHHEGTGNWFLNGGQFHEWKKNPGSLWIEGQSGAGKSVLSSSVIAQLFDNKATANTSAVAYFYFDFRNEQNQLVEVMLRSIILQLSAQSPNTYMVLDQQYNLSSGQTLPTYQNLLDILDKLLLDLGSTYIVLDALDECNEHDLLVQFILLLRGWSSKTPLHLLFTSQTREMFTASFEGMEHVALELKTTQADIAAFVTSELKSNFKLKRWAKHTVEITTKVVEKSNGMFRLADCLLTELSRRKVDPNLDSILANLPDELFKIYDRFLEPIHADDFVFVERALRWLVWSARPLSLAELEDTLAFDFSDPHRHVFQPTQRDECANRVCSLLEGLVTVSMSTGDDDSSYDYEPRYPDPPNEAPVVVLAHASVADYLKSPQFVMRHKCDLNQGCSHTFLAQTCVGYLLHFTDHPLNAETFPNYPLSLYAAEYWSYHLLRCDDRATLETSAMYLLEGGSDQYAVLNHLHGPGWFDYSPDWQRDGPPPLHLCVRIGYTEGVHFLLKKDTHEDDTVMAALRTASRLGHMNIVRLLLEKGANYNAVDAENGSVLQAASDGGHTEIVRLLLEKGADVNATGVYYGSTLQAASKGGHTEIVRLLLEEGADVNAAGGYSGSALQAASYAGSPELVRILLEKGADVNAEGGEYGNALQAASYHGSPEIVQILLKEGADVNAAGGFYGNALQASSIGRHTAIVRLLLEKGADVNAEGGEYGTALQAASYHGSPEIVRILLEKGPDVNAAGGLYGSALQAASYHGSPEIVRILLKKGADVNVAGGFYGSALQAASNQGSPEIVRILLKEGADVNATGGRCGNALQTASFTGSLEVVRILLREGADVNVAGGYYGSALQAASVQGRLEIVRLLLESGADVNTTCGEYGSALQAACIGDEPEIVRILLEKDADVNATGGDYGTVLRAASYWGRTEIVQLLLEKGADVNASGGQYGSPLQVAFKRSHTEIVHLLREHGAVDENSEEEEDEDEEDEEEYEDEQEEDEEEYEDEDEEEAAEEDL